jgi:hypothetical protein
MLYVTAALTGLSTLLIVLRERDLHRLERVHADHAAQVEAIRTDTAAQLATVLEQAAMERRSLLDRIQHPQAVQHPQMYVPAEQVEPETLQELSREETELAYVGMEVPPGVSVGMLGAEARGDNVD